MNTPIRYVIIDDEHNSSELLEGLLRTFMPDLQFAGRADNAEEGINLLECINPELVFLDIEMPDASGFDLLDRVQSIKRNVIFVTGYDKYAIRAIKYSAFDYLLKPVDVAEMQSTLHRFEKSRQQNQQAIDVLKSHLITREKADRIVLSHKRGNILLQLDDIVAISTIEGYALFHTRKGAKYIATNPLSYYEEILPERFFRVHKSAIVNLKHIEKYDRGRTGQVYMRNGISFEIAARRKPQFLSLIKPL